MLDISTKLERLIQTLDTKFSKDSVLEHDYDLTISDRIEHIAKQIGKLSFGGSDVTPETYGAIGDGIADDTKALQDAFNSGSNIVFPNNKTYKSNTLTINNSGISIIGNNSTIIFATGEDGIDISKDSHDILIQGLNIQCEYVKDSGDPTNSCIAIREDSEKEYCAYNIVIDNCSFDGGVAGIGASSTKNLVVTNCKFGSFIFKPSDGAGGYGILLQSCINTFIQNCVFDMGKYGRHDVYVSVNQSKKTGEYPFKCVNTYINHCAMDHSSLELDSSSHFYSTSTVSIVCRASDSTIVTNCSFKSVTGAVAYNNADGDISGSVCSNCYVNTPVRNTGTSEARQIISLSGSTGANALEANVRGITVKNVPEEYKTFCTLRHSKVIIDSCNIGPTRISSYGNVYLGVHDVITDIPMSFIIFEEGYTMGYCHSIIFTELTGSKYYARSGASYSDDFFYPIKTLSDSILTDENGIIDSARLITGGILTSNSVMLDAICSDSSNILIPFVNSGKYYFKCVSSTSMSAVASEVVGVAVSYFMK